ncbi:MAG TPA: ribosome biogenesis GTPase YqeH [Tetragenococcus sp.]|nr:ribosome biogenesis GTPase YqeH [Tetragenococcus sp.]
MTEALHCVGCGAILQTEDKEKIGYTPAAVLAKAEKDNEVYCQRCFRLRHYNEIQAVDLTDDDFLRILNEMSQVDALIVNVVDIFDFNGSLIPGLHRFAGNNPVLLVGNKADILPKSLRKTKLTQWMRQRAHEAGLRPVDVILTSAKKGDQLEELLEKIDFYRKGRDVYVVGTTNVGKSTLINQIIQQSTAIKDLITTSRFPGTTLDKIEIPLEDGQYLIDTPGIIHDYQMAHFLGERDLNIIAPQKEIKPKVYQLAAGQTLFLGGLARFDYIKGEKSSFTVYVSNDLLIHRTKTIKADEFYQKHSGELLQPPHSDEVADFPELVQFEFSIKEKTDIVFAGLGWITAKNPGIIRGWAPKGVDLVVRQALV